MVFYGAFFLVMCIILLWVTIQGKDAFPFSHYPMFSGLYDPDKVKVFRIALETQNGVIDWWHTEFYRYPQFVGKRLYQLGATSDNKKTNVFLSLERNKLLLDVLRLIESEGGTKNYRAFHIIERTLNNNLEIVDKTLEIIPFNNLKNGRIS